MTPDEFRARLKQLGLSQSALARLLKEAGDPAAPTSIVRRVQRWAAGDAKIPGEAITLLARLERTGDSERGEPAG